MTQSSAREAGPVAEYSALLESAALLGASDRFILRVRGEQAARMLHGLTTNDVEGLPVGQALYAFMLTPKGRPVAELRLLRLEAEFLLDMPMSCRDRTVAHLGKYLPPIFATWEEAGLERLSVIGPRAGAAIDAWSGKALTKGIGPLIIGTFKTDYGDAVLVGREVVEGPGFDLYVPQDALEQTRSAVERSVSGIGGRAVGPETWEVVRVERGIPVIGIDFGEGDLAQEAGQDARAISFDKGCYTGQEVVARIHFRGHVNRILRGFRLPDSSLGPGTPLFVGDRQRAALSAVVRSPRFGPIGLGLARAEIEAGTRLSTEPGGDPEVELVELPFDSPAEP